MRLEIETPRALQPLLYPSRYKGAYGGRGSSKSYFFADLIIERCILKKTDAVCVREIQKSLDKSAKKLIESEIERLKVGHLFKIQKSQIVTPGGGVIIFQGMQDHTADSVKSLEGFDIAWIEEADTLGQKSLDLLRPTIRKEGSEIWASWNPKNPYDPIDRFFRGADRPANSVSVEVNYPDNPFFPNVLRDEMEEDKKTDYPKYLHVWLGQYKLAGDMALIQLAAVMAAVGNTLPESSYRHAPRILGVDCARYGDDETVICFRQGRKVHWIRAFNNLNEMEIARKIINAIQEVHPQGVFMDVTGGYGAGAYDRLLELRYSVLPVIFSGKSDENPELYQNKRIEIWDAMRAWFGLSVSIPHDAKLESGLVAPECIYNKSTGRKQLESKKDIKERLGMSPDRPDALAITFAYPVAGSEEVEVKTKAEKDWLKVTGHGEDKNTAFHLV
jgi:hypothetical protein